jgi:hypothetical protein
LKQIDKKLFGKVVTLNWGLTGKIIGATQTEYILIYAKGGRVQYAHPDEIVGVK